MFSKRLIHKVIPVVEDYSIDSKKVQGIVGFFSALFESLSVG